MLTYPDYGAYPSTIVTPEGDLGEIIARLGGPRFRREGRILSYADFSPGLDGWQPTNAVTIVQRLGVAYVGNASLRFSGAPPNNPYMTKTVPNTQSLRMGLECAINQESSWNLTTLEIQFYTPTAFITYAVRVNAILGKIDYLDSNNTYQQLVTNIDAIKATFRWMNLKLVADANATPPTYVRFSVNNTEYAMGQQPYSQPQSIDQGTKFQIQVQSADGVNNFINWVDAPVITTNEH